jgi:hypothetical protein
MVQLSAVEPPLPGEPPVSLGNKVVDSNALTEDSISTPELPHQESIRQKPGSGFAKPPPVFTSDPTAADADPKQDSDHSVPPPPDWHNRKNAKSRKIALTVAVVLGSIISASILFSVIVRNRPINAARQEAASQDVGVQQPEDPREDASQNTGEVTGEVTAQESVPETSAVPQSAAADIDAATSAPSLTADESSTADEFAPADSSLGSDLEADPPGTLTNVAGREATDPTKKVQLPTDLLPDSPLLGGNVLEGMPGLGDAPTEDAADVSSMTELPDDLKGLFEGINLERPHMVATQPTPKTIDEIQVDRAADFEIDVGVAIDQVKPINMRQALGLPLALQAADPAGYPLNDLMLVLGQLSGVPIELEWVSFDIVGLPIDQRVKLPANWLTIEEILTAVCDANNATFEEQASSITVRPTDESFQLAMEQILDLSDLGTESASGVTTARQLLGQVDGDRSRVSVPKESGPQQVAVLVCEAVRRMRGVKGKLPDQTLLRWAGEYKDQVNAWPRLEQGVSGPKRLQPSSFVSLVRQIASLNGATCYINWRDGARRGLRPTDKKMPRSGEGISAADTLSQILQPESMHVRIVDPSHWWVGADASFDRFPVVVWFQDEKAPESMRTTIETILAGASAQQEMVGSVTVDPVSNLCVALMPRYLLRQMPRLLKSEP